MATAPNWSQEEKKRRNGLQRGVGNLGELEDIVRGAQAAAAAPRTPPAPIDIESLENSPRRQRLEQATNPAAYLSQTFRNIPGDYRAGGLGGVVSRGLARDAEILDTFVTGGRGDYTHDATAPTDTPASAPLIPKNDARNQFGNVFDSRSELSPANLQAAGLSRVVKTGDGAYTDDPNATGEVRYYNRLGRRADVGRVDGLTRNTTPAQHLAAENAAQLDLTSPANTTRVLESGREAQRIEKSLAAEAAQRDAARTLAQMPPEALAELQAAQLKEQGLNSRAAQTVAATLRGQDLTANTAQATLRRNQTLDAQKQDNLALAYERENPGGALQEQLGELSNIAPTSEALAAILADPADKRGARARGLFRQLLAAQTGDANVDPSMVTRASGWRRYLNSPLTIGFGGDTFDANNNLLFDDQFSSDDLGLTDAQIEAFLRAEQLARSGAN